MSEAKEQVRIPLTPEQKQMVKQVTGKDAGSPDLTVQELEERIAPATYM